MKKRNLLAESISINIRDKEGKMNFEVTLSRDEALALVAEIQNRLAENVVRYTAQELHEIFDHAVREEYALPAI